MQLCLQAIPCCWSRSQDDADDLPSFPPSEQLWEGGRFTFLGSGVYYKKILFISVQVSLSCTLRPLTGLTWSITCVGQSSHGHQRMQSCLSAHS